MSQTSTLALEALKLAVRQNGCDMLMTGDELRKCEKAIAALEAEAAQPVQPAQPAPQQAAPGWQLVPIEPTPEMIGAMAVEEASGRINGVDTIGMAGAGLAYEAMLKVAPRSAQ